MESFLSFLFDVLLASIMALALGWLVGASPPEIMIMALIIYGTQP